MTLVPRKMINNDPYTKCDSDMESYSEVDVGKEVNMSGVVPV